MSGQASTVSIPLNMYVTSRAAAVRSMCPQCSAPDSRPLQLAMALAEALNRAHRGAVGLRWQLVAEAPAEGRLEATATTAFMGSRGDLVVRVRAFMKQMESG